MGCVYLCACICVCVCEGGVYVLRAGRGLGEARLSQVCVVFFFIRIQSDIVAQLWFKLVSLCV